MQYVKVGGSVDPRQCEHAGSLDIAIGICFVNFFCEIEKVMYQAIIFAVEVGTQYVGVGAVIDP